MVQVELRDSTSICFVCSAGKRSLADSGTNVTFVGSLKIAAARARQKSASKPLHCPSPAWIENPSTPWLTPQTIEPRSFTVSSVCAAALPTARHPSSARRRERPT